MKALWIIPITIGLFSSAPVMAATEAECAIWLCLPTGFPSGCGDAKSAFLKRIKKRKSPLPSFASCVLGQSDLPSGVDGSSGNMSYKEGVSAKMPDGRYIDNTSCLVIRRHGEIVTWKPYGCISTDSWVQTFMDGKAYGDKYYY